MASSEFGSLIDAELNSLSISTQEQVATFRALPWETGDMSTMLASLKTSTGQAWVSRKRVRHDTIRLLKEGSL